MLLLLLLLEAEKIVEDRKSTRLNSSHANISYAVFCLKKKKNNYYIFYPFSSLSSISILYSLFLFTPHFYFAFPYSLFTSLFYSRSTTSLFYRPHLLIS